jgi:hypothetical protein
MHTASIRYLPLNVKCRISHAPSFPGKSAMLGGPPEARSGLSDAA